VPIATSKKETLFIPKKRWKMYGKKHLHVC
jgi:hypothetical protein